MLLIHPDFLKNKSMTSRIIISLPLLIFFNYLAFTQVSFEFSIKPGTNEWKNLHTEKERAEVLQIPDSILDKLTTEELILACLNYPAFFHFAAFNDIQTGIFALITRFNGLQELTKRQDAGSELLSIYSNMSLEGYNDETLQLEESYWPLRIMYLELLLAQEPILGRMPVNKQMELLFVSRDKLTMKLNSDLKSIFDIQPTLLIMCRIIKNADFVDNNEIIHDNENLDVFYRTGTMPNSQTFYDLVEQVDLILEYN